MALQQPFATDTSDNPNAVHRVTEVHLDYRNDRARIHRIVFVRTQDQGRRPIDHQDYVVTGADFTTYFGLAALSPQGRNPVERSYVYLKTLLEYQGAVDV